MATNEKDTCMLKLVDIVKDYGAGDNVVHALRGINLDFRKSEFVSILGPSGCGKTTLLNIVGGLDRYTSGDLIIDGVSTKYYKDADWDTYRNNRIGFVFQSYNLIPHQSVNSNVELALTLSGISKAERKTRVEKVLKQVGLAGLGHKKPNQLSGGQMQRVAIARALINDPEIILADEPTGALDTETSVQIMELLKEVAKDRLVIMVTHNPELAKEYSTRIINLLDGEMTGDTNPLKVQVETKAPKRKKKRAKMGFLTAMFLSLSNLATKRGRTILTSFAGSIGIIGIALVLAVSTGFSGYMSKLQTDTMSTYPLTISEASVDLSSLDKVMSSEIKEKFPAVHKFYKKEFMANLISMLKTNDLSPEFLTYLNAEEKKNLTYDIQYDYGFDMNDYLMTDIHIFTPGKTDPTFQSLDAMIENIKDGFTYTLEQSELGQTMTVDTIREYIPTIQEMPNSQELIDAQYDLIYGEKIDLSDPNSYNKMYLVVDKYNSITDITLALLGLSQATYDTTNNTFTFDGAVETDFSDVVTYTDDDGVLHEGKKYYIMSNDEYYTKTTLMNNPISYPLQDGQFVPYELAYYDVAQGRVLAPGETGATFNSIQEISIAGVLRMKENTTDGVLKQGIAYTKLLTDKILEINDNSEIVNFARNNTGNEKTENDYTAQIIKGFSAAGYTTEIMQLRRMAGLDTPSKINIYPKDYQSKEDFKAYLDEWNKQFYDDSLPDSAENDKDDPRLIYYSDMMSMIFSVMNTIIDSVSYVLIAFTAISLIVSSIMIGIITYVSVVERTKEIGVLRSIGARKKDISRIFNAETFLIGLFAGLAGIAIAYLLTIPINLVLGSFIDSAVPLVSLKVSHALILVTVSFVLTLIAGIIPARIAAKKDPVVALRSE